MLLESRHYTLIESRFFFNNSLCTSLFLMSQKEIEELSEIYSMLRKDAKMLLEGLEEIVNDLPDSPKKQDLLLKYDAIFKAGRKLKNAN